MRRILWIFAILLLLAFFLWSLISQLMLSSRMISLPDFAAQSMQSLDTRSADGWLLESSRDCREVIDFGTSAGLETLVPSTVILSELVIDDRYPFVSVTHHFAFKARTAVGQVSTVRLLLRCSSAFGGKGSKDRGIFLYRQVHETAPLALHPVGKALVNGIEGDWAVVEYDISEYNLSDDFRIWVLSMPYDYYLSIRGIALC